MSSSLTAPTSTTGSSTSSVFRPDFPASAPATTVIACGALGGYVRAIAARRGWPVAVQTLPAMLHNRPSKITLLAEQAVLRGLAAGATVALAYADCGTYGALDAVCAKYGVARLPGLHCYDLFAGPSRLRAMFDAEPGTYVLTDFLLRGFGRLVLGELGLDRHPELWPDYFRHYTRLVWLTQEPTPSLVGEAERVARLFGLPLTRVDTGTGPFERELERLVMPA